MYNMVNMIDFIYKTVFNTNSNEPISLNETPVRNTSSPACLQYGSNKCCTIQTLRFHYSAFYRKIVTNNIFAYLPVFLRDQNDIAQMKYLYKNMAQMFHKQSFWKTESTLRMVYQWSYISN